MSAGSPLPFAFGDTANLPCTNTHLYSRDQHTLVIDRDEENSDAEENVVLTLVLDGQPQGNIAINRVALIEALGGTA